MKKATIRWVWHRAEVGNSVNMAHRDVADDGVGDGVRKPSDVGERAREFGGLQVLHAAASTAKANIYPPLGPAVLPERCKKKEAAVIVGSGTTDFNIISKDFNNNERIYTAHARVPATPASMCSRCPV